MNRSIGRSQKIFLKTVYPFTYSPIHLLAHSPIHHSQLILNSRRAGFTLLEIMIALAITGGLLITLIYTLNYHLGLVERHEAVTIASLLAREKIVEVERSLGDKKGVFPESYSAYSYETDIRESYYPGISEILVIVRWDKEEVRFSELIQSPQ